MNVHYEYDFHKNHELIVKKESYTNKGLTGLTNLGNKCFLNSILQCLSNTLKLTDYFLSNKYKEDDPDQLNKNRKEYFIVISYINLLINIWEQNQTLKPKSFVENISKFINKYFSLEQQDSHECLIYILDLLHRGLSYEIEVEINGEIQNETDNLMKQSLEQWTKFYKTNYSFIIETFNGLFYNKIVCNSCKFSENVFEPFNCISLNLPHKNESGTLSLNSLLQNYFNNSETINTWNCEKCNNKGCLKSIKTWSFPNYLIIHFKKFTNDNKKIQTHIDFPLDDLDLTHYISKDKNDPNNYIYSLYAINYHSGTVESGHYWSACKNLNKSWYIFNDANVSKVNNTTNILKKDSYILFYARKMIK